MPACKQIIAQTPCEKQPQERAVEILGGKFGGKSEKAQKRDSQNR
jgi:hypothetical protein